MSLNSEMKDHMDAVRKVTGVSGLLNLASSTDILNSFSAFTSTDVAQDVDLNSFFNPGVYSLWLKYAKNSPLEGHDEGAMLLVAGGGNNWYLQLIASFYDGMYYRADFIGNIQSGNHPWHKLGLTGGGQ